MYTWSNKMKKRDNYNAVLENWTVVRQGSSTIGYGKIYGDDKNRFKNGDDIITSSVVTSGPYVEGNIIKTRNTNYLLGKRAGTVYDDGHLVLNSSGDQIASLRDYMSMRGYNLVYTDSSVFFRLKDPLARTPCNQVSFRTAVVMHNNAVPFSAYDDKGVLRFYDTPKHMAAFRKVKKVKLQVTGNRIIVQSHKISVVQQVDNVSAVEALLNSL
jgi:hypothetical protein